MDMLWKRMGERGKYWRHVYKALMLLEYLIKAGAPHIVQEALDHLFALQVLRDFVFVDSDGVDQGLNGTRELAPRSGYG